MFEREHDWATSFSLFTFTHWRRKWQPTPVFWPGESQGWGAWWAAIYEVAQSRTWLKRLSNLEGNRDTRRRKKNLCCLNWPISEVIIIIVDTALILFQNWELGKLWYISSYPSSTVISGYPSSSAAAKSLQSCPTLCDPRDGSPPGSTVPGILQARTLEWVAISFSISKCDMVEA